MRIYGPTSPRSFPLDRNPTTVAVMAGTFTATAAVQTLATYTVPAARRALLVVVVQGVVDAVLTGRGELTIVVSPGGVGAQTMPFETRLAAVAGDQVNGAMQAIQLKATDVVQVQGLLSVAGGTFIMNGGIQGVEYDA